VGVQEDLDEGLGISCTLSAKNNSLSKLFSAYPKHINPEEDPEDKWEEDTNDTEIMKNINSLLDSGKLYILNKNQNRPL
jgi:hypothetical protein